MGDCSDLTVLAARLQLVLDNYSTANGTNVTVTCSLEGSSLVGSSHLTCMNAQWSSELPHCSDNGGLTEREKVIVGVSCAIVAVILVFLFIVGIFYCRMRIRNKQRREERLAATLERLSIRDPLDELVRRESGRSSFGNPAYTPSSSDDPMDPSSKRTLVEEERLPNPVSRRQITWHYPDTGRAKYQFGSSRQKADSWRNGYRIMKLFKVWDYTRTRKQFVFAEGLDELVQKGGEKLSLSGPIRVVLEEDGTEIDNDAVLRACAGMVFLLLEQNQIWSKPELVLSVHEYSNNLNHYRYDMDEKL